MTAYLSVLTLRAAPGKRGELVDLYAELDILRRAVSQPGAIDVTFTEALDDPDAILITATWDDPSSYQAWLDHPGRGEMTAAMAPLLAGEPQATMYRISDSLSADG